jgi:hypothetical protein
MRDAFGRTKGVPMTKSRKRRRWVIVACVFAALLVAGGGYYAVDASTADAVLTLTWPHEFASEDWRDHPDQRHHMAIDLAESGLLAGKSEQWLRANLGDPTEEFGAGKHRALHWDAPSPKRPDDQLIVNVRGGLVIEWMVTPKGVIPWV